MNSNGVFDRVELIAAESRSTIKLKLMPDDLMFKTVLVYAYNPFYMYNIGGATVNGRYGRGNEIFDGGTWNLLNMLRDRVLSGNQARKEVQNEIKNLTPKSAELLKRIILKDLRCGISTTLINKRYKPSLKHNLVPTHEIMKAEEYKHSKVSYPCYISPKIDGLRALYRKGDFYSRKGGKILGLSHLIKEFKSIRTEGPVDGELVVPNKPFDDVSGLIRSHAEVPDAEYWVFDIPLYKNEPFHIRLMYMTELFANLKHVKVIRHIPVHSMQEIEEFYEQCRAAGYEGAMLKSYYHKYRGVRSYDWMKLKPMHSADVKCISIYEGEGKYVGQMGGIVVNFGGKRVSVGSGFSDKQRNIFYSNPTLIVGSIVEILYMEKTPGGSMRHPRFSRIRNDK